MDGTKGRRLAVSCVHWRRGSPRHREVLGVSDITDGIRRAGSSNLTDDHPRYTAIWNILDWPGAVFPTGLVVDPALDAIDPNFSSMGPEDSYNFVQCASSQR